MALNGVGGSTLHEMLDIMDCINCDVNSINSKLQELTALLTTQSEKTQLLYPVLFFTTKIKSI